MVPRDHRSALASYCSDMITSGAMYIGLPHRVAAITPSCRNRANPKSAILRRMSAGWGFRDLPSWASRMFWGLRSRWTIPLLFIATIAPANCRRNLRIVSSLSVPLALR